MLSTFTYQWPISIKIGYRTVTHVLDIYMFDKQKYWTLSCNPENVQDIYQKYLSNVRCLTWILAPAYSVSLLNDDVSLNFDSKIIGKVKPLYIYYVCMLLFLMCTRYISTIKVYEQFIKNLFSCRFWTGNIMLSDLVDVFRKSSLSLQLYRA